MGSRMSRDTPNWWTKTAYLMDYILIVVLGIITALVNKLAEPATRTLVLNDPAINLPNLPATVPDILGLVRSLFTSSTYIANSLV